MLPLRFQNQPPRTPHWYFVGAHYFPNPCRRPDCQSDFVSGHADVSTSVVNSRCRYEGVYRGRHNHRAAYIGNLGCTRRIRGCDGGSMLNRASSIYFSSPESLYTGFVGYGKVVLLCHCKHQYGCLGICNGQARSKGRTTYTRDSWPNYAEEARVFPCTA